MCPCDWQALQQAIAWLFCQGGWKGTIHSTLLLASTSSKGSHGIVGTPECGPFPLGSFPNIDAAIPSLAAYHQLNLTKMGISMGEGGLRVLDVHNRKRLLAVYAGKPLYLCCTSVQDSKSRKCDLCWRHVICTARYAVECFVLGYRLVCC